MADRNIERKKKEQESAEAISGLKRKNFFSKIGTPKVGFKH